MLRKVSAKRVAARNLEGKNVSSSSYSTKFALQAGFYRLLKKEVPRVEIPFQKICTPIHSLHADT